MGEKLLKRYKVSLTIGVRNTVVATRYQDRAGITRFYRDDEVVAEFATVSVASVELIEVLPQPDASGGSAD
jgi:hypothetical protein